MIFFLSRRTRALVAYSIISLFAYSMAASQGNTSPDNELRWQGQPGHYEVWYLTFSHPTTQTGYWIRYTLDASEEPKRETYAQVWFGFFDAQNRDRSFALNERFPMNFFRSQQAPFSIEVGSSRLSHESADGSIQGKNHIARWNLRWTPVPATYRILPTWAYDTDLVRTKVLSPNLHIELQGEIEVDGQRIVLNGEPATQSHIWGRKHADAWAWSHCGDFEGYPDAVLETLSVRFQLGPILSPPISFLFLSLGDERFEFNRFHQAVFGSISFWETGEYQVRAKDRDVRIEVRCKAHPEDMVLATYVDPDGENSYVHNTEVADCTVLLFHFDGLYWKETAKLRANKTAHFEYGGRSPDPAVVRRFESLPP